MAYGEVYVEVDASVIGGGIMPMAIISGNPEPVSGEETFVVWLRWWYDDTTGEGGFTGTGWYVEDPNNPLNKYETEDAFEEYLVKNKPTNLDGDLGAWDPIKKGQFFTDHQGELGANDCFSFGMGS